MIVKILPHKPAGTGRPLGTYLLAAKHEHKGERLGPYIADPDKDKVSWSRTVNSGVDDPMQAIGAIERYNAQNTRWHSVSRWEHVVVAFSDGERATRKQLEVIEDRLMAAIGFGDHPRISATHHDAAHFHMHIAVSRIDPTTLKAEHPRGNYFKLQAEAAKLEIELGLRQERKTLLARERREITDRAALARELNGPRKANGGEMLTSDTEQRTIIDFTRDELNVLFQQAGPSITPGVSESIFGKLAKALDVAATADPAKAVAVELTRAELFSVMLDHTVGRDDAKPLRPDIKANIQEKLREGEDRIIAAEWREANAERARPPSPNDIIERRAELRDGGLEPDQIDRATQRRPAPREQDHADRQRPRGRATPGDALYARYKTEKTIAVGARKQAEQDVYDKFSVYRSELRGFYDLRREQEKLNARQPHRVDRQNAHELLRAQQTGDRVEANQLRARALAAARREHPLPSWETFLEREAGRGDKEAARLVQQNRVREMQHGHER